MSVGGETAPGDSGKSRQRLTPAGPWVSLRRFYLRLNLNPVRLHADRGSQGFLDDELGVVCHEWTPCLAAMFLWRFSGESRSWCSKVGMLRLLNAPTPTREHHWNPKQARTTRPVGSWACLTRDDVQSPGCRTQPTIGVGVGEQEFSCPSRRSHGCRNGPARSPAAGGTQIGPAEIGVEAPCPSPAVGHAGSGYAARVAARSVGVVQDLSRAVNRQPSAADFG